MISVLLLSGGADSVALLNHMLTKTNDDLIVHHIDFSAPFNPLMPENRAKHDRKAKAQLAVLPLILDYFQTIRPFHFEISRVELPPTFLLLPRRWCTLIGASAVTKHGADRLLFGDNMMTTRDANAIFFKPAFNSIFKTLMGMGRMRVIQREVISDEYDRIPHPALIEAPLIELGWGKQEIIRSIPPEIRQLVVYCDFPLENGVPCGECYQCRRFARMSGLEAA